MQKEKILSCIIDDRERELMRSIDERNATAEERKNQDGSYYRLEYECRRLDVADIVISEQVGIERKGRGKSAENHDFTASMKDNRLLQQLPRLQEAYEHPLLIVEGLDLDRLEQSNLHINTIFGFLAKIALMGIGLIPTGNIEQTIIAIERLAYRVQIKEHSALIARSKPKEMSLTEQRAFFLEGLLEAGTKKAAQLIEIFELPGNVLEAIKLSEVMYRSSGTIKGIQGPLANVPLRLGPQFILKNQLMLFGKEGEIRYDLPVKQKNVQKTLF